MSHVCASPGNLSHKFYKTWVKFTLQQRKIKGQKRAVAMRKCAAFFLRFVRDDTAHRDLVASPLRVTVVSRCAAFLRFWTAHAAAKAQSRERRRIALVMGRRVVLRRFCVTKARRLFCVAFLLSYACCFCVTKARATTHARGVASYTDSLPSSPPLRRSRGHTVVRRRAASAGPRRFFYVAFRLSSALRFCVVWLLHGVAPTRLASLALSNHCRPRRRAAPFRADAPPRLAPTDSGGAT